MEHRKSTHICDQCSRTFTSRDALKVHLRLKHDYYHSLFPHYCKHCDAGFTIKSEYQIHLENHKSAPSLLHCLYCPESYENSALLKAHTLSEHKRQTRAFKCGICPKFFYSLPSYNMHKKVHTGETHNCDQCLLTFTKLSGLKFHYKVHLPMEQRDHYYCDQCPAHYVNKKTLKDHKTMSHSSDDVRNYECRYCPSKFKLQGHRHCHEQRVHGERNIPCPNCPLLFPHKDYLKSHLRSCSKKKREAPPENSTCVQDSVTV